MKKRSHYLWLFSICFFIFFSFYLLVKFLFIFFLGAAYEPAVVFHLTPFYLLSGLSNVQLLSISLVLMVFDMYLHLRVNKRNLLLSFLPTSLMISGVGYTIMFYPPGIPYFLHYVLFGGLILVILIDYQYILKGVEASTLPYKPSMTMRMVGKEPATRQTKSFFAKDLQIAQQQVSPLVADNLVELKKVSNAILQQMQIILDDLERKTLRIEQLESKFEEQQHFMCNKRMFVGPGNSPPGSNEDDHLDQKNLVRDVSAEEEIVLKEKIKNHLVIDDVDDIVAIVQRGTFKEISNSFVGFLGYERTELLDKNFFVFIAPRGFEDVKKYYLNRLKGVNANSFRTFIRTKAQTELLVEITVTPTIYKGDSAEFLSVKEVKNNS